MNKSKRTERFAGNDPAAGGEWRVVLGDGSDVHQIASRGSVLPAAEGGLRTERVAQLLIGDDLQQGIVAQTIRCT
jgi:hypothetical protein